MLLCVCCVPHKKLHEGDLRREQNWLGLVVWSAKKTWWFRVWLAENQLMQQKEAKEKEQKKKERTKKCFSQMMFNLVFVLLALGESSFEAMIIVNI